MKLWERIPDKYKPDIFQRIADVIEDKFGEGDQKIDDLYEKTNRLASDMAGIRQDAPGIPPEIIPQPTNLKLRSYFGRHIYCLCDRVIVKEFPDFKGFEWHVDDVGGFIPTNTSGGTLFAVTRANWAVYDIVKEEADTITLPSERTKSPPNRRYTPAEGTFYVKVRGIGKKGTCGAPSQEQVISFDLQPPNNVSIDEYKTFWLFNHPKVYAKIRFSERPEWEVWKDYEIRVQQVTGTTVPDIMEYFTHD